MHIKTLLKKLIPVQAFAAAFPRPTSAEADQLANVGRIMNNILKPMWIIFVAFAILMFLVAGFNFLAADGDPTKIGTAKKAVLWGVVGIVVGFLAFAIVNIISFYLSR